MNLVKCTDCKFAVPRKTCYRNGKNPRGQKRPPAKYSSIKRACIGFEAIEMNTETQNNDLNRATEELIQARLNSIHIKLAMQTEALAKLKKREHRSNADRWGSPDVYYQSLGHPTCRAVPKLCCSNH